MEIDLSVYIEFLSITTHKIADNKINTQNTQSINVTLTTIIMSGVLAATEQKAKSG